jgi:hypothetical protein
VDPHHFAGSGSASYNADPHKKQPNEGDIKKNILYIIYNKLRLKKINSFLKIITSLKNGNIKDCKPSMGK